MAKTTQKPKPKKPTVTIKGDPKPPTGNPPPIIP